jgi:hypothetical protein
MAARMAGGMLVIAGLDGLLHGQRGSLFTTRLPGGLPIDSRRGLLASQSAVPSKILVMRPWRSSGAGISTGISVAGSAALGHQAQSSSRALIDPAACGAVGW